MTEPTTTPRIIISVGEPAGIGPDIMLKAAASGLADGVVAIADIHMLTARAESLAALGTVVTVIEAGESGASDSPTTHPKLKPKPGPNPGHHRPVLPVIHHPCPATVTPGKLNPDNSGYVIACIERAVDLCLAGAFDAMVTAPVNKAIINQAGIPFCGHTEWIARRCNAPSPVMMLSHPSMRLCLLSNHIPLAQVPASVTAARLEEVIAIILADLRRLFKIPRPTLGVCGLNPHAGEGGYIGAEEADIITPTLDKLRAQAGHEARLIGPISADTAYTPARLADLDAVLAMYHDQGLPAIKSRGFGETVNLTLGLPIIRTSVDHGTAAELAGAFTACESSLQAAIAMAAQLAARPAE